MIAGSLLVRSVSVAMDKPLTIFVLTMLAIVIAIEVMLWREKDEKFPRWKLRAFVYGAGPILAGVQSFYPELAKRLDLIVYGGGVLLLVLIGVLLVFCSRMITKLNRALREAQGLHEFGQTAQAITLLTKHRRTAARISKATESGLVSQIADFAFALGDTEAAERYLKEAEALCPQSQGIYATRAEMCAKSGNLDGACEALKSGLEKLPTSVWLHTMLAERLADAGRTEEAREVLARTIELMDQEKYVDVVQPAEWQEKRIGPLIERLGQTEGPLVTDAD